MNHEPSRSVSTSVRTRHAVRNLAIVLIATIPPVACSSEASDEPRADDVAAPSGPTTTADVQRAIGLAQRFVHARDSWDGRAVRALVTDDAVIDDFDVSDADDYLPIGEIEQATGWRYLQPECSEDLSGPPIQVLCTYTMQNAWSRALGVGPFTGSNFRFVVVDGQIERVRHVFDFSRFDPQVFTVFSDWLNATHPDDVDVMFDAGSGNFSLTPEAIALFEQHTTEFVSSLNNPESDGAGGSARRCASGQPCAV